MKNPTIALIAALLMPVSLMHADPSRTLPRPDGAPADLSKPVQVFILMGQSNMFGMGDVGPIEKPGTLEQIVRTGKKYPHLLDEAGGWSVRKDVRYVQVMQGRGDKFQLVKNDWHSLQGKAIGPELQFGHIMGHVLDAPVLILKACIGNRSLGWDLLPPGSERYVVDGRTYAGYKDTPDSWIEGQPKKEVKWYAGKQYDDDVANAKKVLADLPTYYPGASGYQVAGFVWWQGHKDQNPVHASRYEQNLVRLIHCLRKDFNAPKAPFVMATIGFDGWNLKEPGLTVAKAQLALGDPAKHPEFAGSVRTIEARDFWPDPAASPNPKQGYHYYRNAGTFMQVGDSLGWAMADLLKPAR